MTIAATSVKPSASAVLGGSVALAGPMWRTQSTAATTSATDASRFTAAPAVDSR